MHLILDPLVNSNFFLRGAAIGGDSYPSDEVLQLHLFCLHQVAFDEAEALGDEKTRHTERIELLKQIRAVDFISILQHYLTVLVKVLVNGSQVANSICE